ncbi:MAG TPA: sulfite exporter TauE/SafE family protein, partial [Alphaproteobacteria bacterium]|nr:sulfite exporter TauE/SafE family protein [Alphaproteobacteria bacterium]
PTILYVFLSLFLGGLLKGVVGLGLPLVSMPLLTFAVPLKTAVALVIVPIFVTNLAQSFQGGLASPTFRRFWLSMIVLVATIALTAQALVTIDEKILYTILGTTLILLTLTLRFRPSMQIKPAQEPWAAPVAAGAGGVLGGFTGIYGPPVMMYLACLRLKKGEFVAAVSQFFVAGNIGLTIGLVSFGGAGPQELALSAAATVPTYVGLWLGQRVHARLDESRFTAVLYIVYLATGASFLIRAFG